MDLNQKIVVSLERISQAFRVLLWNESKQLGLSPIQIQILNFLLTHSREKRKISYLAKEFDLTKATISDSVKILFRKSFVDKEYAPKDSRSYTLHLTSKGLETATKTSVFFSQIENSVDKLPQSEKENLLINLIGIIEALHNSGVISMQRMCFSCSHYSRDYDGNAHFCKLMNRSLLNQDLQINCPEFESIKIPPIV